LSGYGFNLTQTCSGSYTDMILNIERVEKDEL